MATSSPTRSSPAAVALVLLAPAALAGCGYTLERTGRIEARELALAAAEARGRSLERRVGELEGALEAERRAARDAVEAERRAAADDLAALGRRLRAARVQVAALGRPGVVTDALSAAPGAAPDDGAGAARERPAGPGRPAEEAEARRRALQAEAEWTQQILAERQQAAAGAERRLEALRAEVAAVEADLAGRRGELAGLREQVARERAGAASPPAAGAGLPPEGGGAPR
jgi:uncharacterized protein YlxW (UPF0749 family)